MRRKVLVVCPWISGHAQQWIGDGSNYDIRVLTFHGVREKDKHDDRVFNFSLGNKFFNILFFPLYILYHYIKFRPELTHVHFLSSYGLLAYLIPGHKILSIWGSDINGRASNNFLFRELCKRALLKYDLINSPSSHITRKLLDWGVKKDKIFTLQYGVNVDLINKYTKKEVSNSSDDYIISSIRNWDEVYQIEKLIKCWEKINIKNCKLWIFGHSLNNEVKEKIHQLVSGVDNISIIGFLEKDEFYLKLSSSDAFISVPTMDGSPLSVMECMVLNLEPILTDIPFNRYDVRTNKDCLIPVDFNEDDLYRAINSCINEKDLNRLVENKNNVEKNNDLYTNRCVMFSKYKQLIG